MSEDPVKTPEEELVRWDCDGLGLAARLLRASRDALPEGLILHGGGESDSRRTRWLTRPLAEAGLSTLALDFSGHGESGGTLRGSSLARRLREARSALRFFDPPGPGFLCGSSMGGDTVLRLLPFLPEVRTVILFAPALYDEAAFSLPFGPAFREVIRRPGSWQRCRTVEHLTKYDGRLLIFVGDGDDVIPPGVLELFRTSRDGSSDTLTLVHHLQSCPHRIHDWLKTRETRRLAVLEAVFRALGERSARAPSRTPASGPHESA